MDKLNSFLYTPFFDAMLAEWALLFSVSIALNVAVIFLWQRLLRKAGNLAAHSARTWDDILVHFLSRTSKLFLLILILYVVHRIMDFSGRSQTVFTFLLKIGIFFQTALWADELAAILLRKYIAHRNGERISSSQIEISAYSAIRISSRFIVWAILLVVLLDNLGVNISALVTGLGIGGIAVALAMQNILGDIFASLSIVMDHPFEVGDFIIVGDKLGTVEKIGLKTSRIKSLSGEQLIFPNRKLVDSEIQNFKRMEKRRIVFRFGVEYDSTIEKLESVPGIVRSIFKTIEDAVVDRVHCHRFAESSIDFEVVYIMQKADYNAYMDVQQSINFQLFRRFSEEGISFALPKRTIRFQSEDLKRI